MKDSTRNQKIQGTKIKNSTHRYLEIVEWSEEDQCYIGSAPPLIGKCCHGQDEKAVYEKLREIVEEWIQIHEKVNLPLPKPSAGKSYSGKLMLRVGEDLHRALAIRALSEGKSLNSYITNRLQSVA